MTVTFAAVMDGCASFAYRVREHPEASVSTIFTIGYEGTDIERFIAALVDARVDVLADVRAVTVSRKPGFSKNGLRARLAAAGIEYVHLGGLGDPKPGREAARAGKYDEFRAIYGRHLATDDAQAALTALAELASGRKTCLMCFEREPSECHRTIVARAIPAGRIKIIDLYGDGSPPKCKTPLRLPS